MGSALQSGGVINTSSEKTISRGQRKSFSNHISSDAALLNNNSVNKLATCTKEGKPLQKDLANN
jgi:hypothetical protein